MAKPHCAVVSRFRGDHVARADVLLHLAGRPVRKARKESGGERNNFRGGGGGPARGLFPGEKKDAGGSVATRPPGLLGSGAGVAGAVVSARALVIARGLDYLFEAL